MRRPRHKLQISTFPFLAVLLGAMGSLIFLLLVMDRRAKIVARNKVREAQEARQTALASADEKRRADWERQRQQLHDMLAAQEHVLRGQLQQTLGTLERTQGQLHTSATVQQQLQERIDAERAKLLRQREDLRQRQAALTQSSQLAETSKTELARVTRDLLDLEQTLDALRRLREQQQPTYSLVPYRGQRGANRMPIYVECTAAGLVFLPDGQRLSGTNLDIALIRTEVERRHGPLVKAARANPFKPNPADEEPYVLFLVRPGGIESYYRGQNALRGYQIDFGYELVDADWTLDVPSAAEWKVLAQSTVPDRSAVSRSQPGFLGSGARSQMTAGTPSAAFGSATPGNNTVGVSLGAPVGNDVASPSGGAIGSSPTGARGTSIGAASGAGAPMNVFANQMASPPSPSPGVGFAPPSGVDPGNSKGDGQLAFRPAMATAPSSILDGPAPGLKVPGAGVGGQAAAADGSSAKQQASLGSGATGTVNDAPPPEPGNAMNRLALPSPVAQKQTKVSPVSIGRVLGNRDFIVTIACYGEGVLVTPGGASFTWSDKNNASQTDEALVRTILQLVQRRQATVRAGEPPYRAVLRFEVHEQGRRTYHRVFPLLEGLRLPMVREDVEE